jgi:hypothetical protein
MTHIDNADLETVTGGGLQEFSDTYCEHPIIYGLLGGYGVGTLARRNLGKKAPGAGALMGALTGYLACRSRTTNKIRE